jgi:superfamily II DNA/RNA helicase
MGPLAVILAPVRELAEQIYNEIEKFLNPLSYQSTYQQLVRKKQHKLLGVVGGVSKQSQIQSIKNGVDVIVATPGRLLDLVHEHIITTERYFSFFSFHYIYLLCSQRCMEHLKSRFSC